MNTIGNILNSITSFITNSSKNSRAPLPSGIARVVTAIILGVGTIGIAYGLSALWRNLRQVDKNETQEKISQFFRRIFAKNHTEKSENPITAHSFTEQPNEFIGIQPIDPHFTRLKSIAEQRNAHNIAKTYMQEELSKINAEVFFVSPSSAPCPEVQGIQFKHDLDPAIFTWENTQGVQGDIQRDGKLLNHVVLYGVASQFNACEAVTPFTPNPGTAVQTYKGDPTQGPGAQLQFPDQQVEIINNGANLGFNGLCQILDDTTRMTVRHGYLTPKTPELADIVIRQLREDGHKMEFPCVGNIPKKEGNTEKVYEMLVAAPAFGDYSIMANSIMSDNQKKEVEFLCALHGYRAQFQQAIQLATLNPEKQVVFKPTAPGLGVFGNRIENVARGFYLAADEFQKQLAEKNINNIQVRFQVYKGGGDARTMATTLGLNEAKN